MNLEPRQLIHLLPLLLLAVALLLFLPRLFFDDAGVPVAEDAGRSAFAGSRLCRECHDDVYDAWSRSHHALAEQLIDPAKHGVAFRGRDGERREIVHGGERSYVRENRGQYEIVTRGGDGRIASFEPVRIIGTDPLWQAVVARPGGRYQVTALAYDPARDEWFDATASERWQPHESGFWANRGTTWNHMCAYCHTTDLRKGYDSITDTYDTTYVELGVGCESCHGPHRAHARKMRDEGRISYARDAREDRWDPATFMSRPATQSKIDEEHFEALDFEPIPDTCGSCHSRRGELTGEFRPGDNYLDHFRPAIPDETDIYYADGQVRDEDYVYVSFLSSRMYLVGVRCLHCHDPHSATLKQEGNALCLNCHKERIDPAAHSHHDVEQPGGRCVDCHMPITTYMERDPRRDHGFTIPDPLLTRELGIPNACNRCHADRDVDWAVDATVRWYGEKMERPTRERARTIAAARENRPSVEVRLLEMADSASSPLWRAVATGLLGAWAGEHEGAADHLVRALSSPSALVRARAVRALEPWVVDLSLVAANPAYERFARGVLALLDDSVRLVRVNAAWALRRYPAPSRGLGGSRSFVVSSSTLAGRDLEQSLHQVLDQPTGVLQNGVFHLDRGDARKAVELVRRATLWNPTDPGSHHWLAIALSEQGALEEAVSSMTTARELDPENPLYAFELGKALAQVDRLEEAGTEFELASRLDPRFDRAWYNLALARWKLGRLEPALEAIVRAEELRPDNPEYLESRAAIHQLLGQERLAEDYRERALRAHEARSSRPGPR